MSRFRCNACLEEYEDYYPPDDTCLKCKKGFVRIIIELQVYEQGMWISMD